ncbi:uncharacterized protein [Rutidosis leptorrhynchoides]|uniref:uncharacterized protein n=1 Tax=Rutidosis leptorrhynchoides TaxID=125765 RepID=UPI003A99CECE
MLQEKFGRIFRLDAQEDALFSERLIQDGTSWNFNWNWKHTPRGRSAAEVLKLEDYLRNFVYSIGESDRWEWVMHNRRFFTTQAFTEILNKHMLNHMAERTATLCNSYLPLKVGIFIWRTKMRRLPVRVDLDKRGIDLDYVRCPVCNTDLESGDHVMLSCQFAKELWDRVFRWWNSSNHNYSSLDDMFKGKRISGSLVVDCKLCQAVEWVCRYIIWNNHNSKVFGKKCWSVPLALAEIQVKSFQWISNRSNRLSLDCNKWITTPHAYDDHG